MINSWKKKNIIQSEGEVGKSGQVHPNVIFFNTPNDFCKQDQETRLVPHTTIINLLEEEGYRLGCSKINPMIWKNKY